MLDFKTTNKKYPVNTGYFLLAIRNWGNRTDGERDTRRSGASPSNRATINASWRTFSESVLDNEPRTARRGEIPLANLILIDGPFG